MPTPDDEPQLPVAPDTADDIDEALGRQLDQDIINGTDFDEDEDDEEEDDEDDFDDEDEDEDDEE